MKIVNKNDMPDITGFLSHFMIEFYYGDFDRLLYVCEPLCHYGLIIEKYGVFDECWPMTEAILDFINNNTWKPDDSKLINLPHCTITKNIQIDVDDTIDDLVAGYDYINSSYNENEKIFDTIVIVVSYNELHNLHHSSIMHELQHAKEDFELRKKGRSAVMKASEYGLSKLLKYKTKDEFEQKLKSALYYFSSFEKNAYVNSIHVEIDELKQKQNRSPKFIYDHIRNYGFYKRYLDNFDFCESILNENDPILRRQILETSNNMSNNNFQNWHQFKHWLKNKVVSFKKKFDEIIPKIIFEELKNTISQGFGREPLKYPEKYKLFLENNNIKIK